MLDIQILIDGVSVPVSTVDDLCSAGEYIIRLADWLRARPAPPVAWMRLPEQAAQNAPQHDRPLTRVEFLPEFPALGPNACAPSPQGGPHTMEPEPLPPLLEMVSEEAFVTDEASVTGAGPASVATLESFVIEEPKSKQWYGGQSPVKTAPDAFSIDAAPTASGAPTANAAPRLGIDAAPKCPACNSLVTKNGHCYTCHNRRTNAARKEKLAAQKKQITAATAPQRTGSVSLAHDLDSALKATEAAGQIEILDTLPLPDSVMTPDENRNAAVPATVGADPHSADRRREIEAAARRNKRGVPLLNKHGIPILPGSPKPPSAKEVEAALNPDIAPAAALSPSEGAYPSGLPQAVIERIETAKATPACLKANGFAIVESPGREGFYVIRPFPIRDNDDILCTCAHRDGRWKPVTSTGLLEAAGDLGIDCDLIAINHWATAIETHQSNHPHVRHLCQSIDQVRPLDVVPGGHVRLLVASPECIHHSRARGGKPMSDQSRATVWHVLEWASALHIEDILVENVKELRDWGPLHDCTCGLGMSAAGPHLKACRRGRPIVAKKGVIYRQFLSMLRALGYKVSETILRAADYGDATTRERLFIRATKSKRRITWPAPTHRPAVDLGVYGDLPTWRSARQIIDWSLEGKSIYGRKKALAPATMRRIVAGLHKFSGLPFLMATGGPTGMAGPRSIDQPLGTILTEDHRALAQPYLVILRNHCDADSVDNPLRTLTTSGAHFGLAEPFFIKYFTGSDAASVNEPVPTICANYEHIGLIRPYVVINRTHADAQDLDDPLRTLTTGGNMGIAEPFLIPLTHSGGPSRSHNIDEPLPTITTAHRGEFGIVDPYLIVFHGGKDSDRRVRSLDTPLSTLDTSNRIGVAEPCVVKFYGTSGASAIDEPLHTITTKDRFAVVSPEIMALGAVDKGDVIGWLDIKFRMLQPTELAGAHSFPKTYFFSGNREDRVKQIGNSVPVQLARALCLSILKGTE